MNLPLRQRKARTIKTKRTKPRRTKAIKCRPHINWLLEEFRCILTGKVCKSTGKPHVCEGPKDPHHSPTRGAGGGDNNVSPICRGGHSLIDSPNWSEKRVEDEYGVSFRDTGASIWQVSPYRWQCERMAPSSVSETPAHQESASAASHSDLIVTSGLSRATCPAIKQTDETA